VHRTRLHFAILMVATGIYSFAGCGSDDDAAEEQERSIDRIVANAGDYVEEGRPAGGVVKMSFGVALRMLAAVDVDGVQCFSTKLNQQTLAERYGPPDRTEDGNGTQTLWYDWLGIVVSSNGEIQSIKGKVPAEAKSILHPEQTNQ
jgi:hypothetical protein